ncbi:hypothetical protein PLICRDRAFT_563049 [Plicaturopsis crispa FD-325 SS-3]|nr:hypothetical protein PLICRDRAFT_563049 [Plicaturopsis crispa FD-325 SS-3]
MNYMSAGSSDSPGLAQFGNHREIGGVQGENLPTTTATNTCFPPTRIASPSSALPGLRRSFSMEHNLSSYAGPRIREIGSRSAPASPQSGQYGPAAAYGGPPGNPCGPSSSASRTISENGSGGSLTSIARPVVATSNVVQANHNRRKNKANFYCPVDGCGGSFTRKDSLRRHLISHTGERHHICIHCRHAFYNRDDKKRHEREQHTDLNRLNGQFGSVPAPPTIQSKATSPRFVPNQTPCQ